MYFKMAILTFILDCWDPNSDYIGNIAMTKTSKTCQRWKDQVPHPHSFSADPSVLDAGNKCRNPDKKDGGPWCFTSDPDTEWEFCDIPLCSGKCFLSIRMFHS